MGNFVNFVEMLQPVSRWWRRAHTIQITLWPAWLAQRLCPHESKMYFGSSDEPQEKDIWRCNDCFKFHMPQAAILCVDIETTDVAK